MLKSGMKLMLVVTGLSALALGTGCGGKSQSQVESMIEKGRAAAIDNCLDAIQAKLDEPLISSVFEKKCDQGVSGAITMLRNEGPGLLEFRTDGDQIVTEISLTPEMIARAQAGCGRLAMPCKEGARQAILELVHACGRDTVGFEKSAGVRCELGREKKPEPVAPAIQNRRDDGCVGMKC